MTPLVWLFRYDATTIRVIQREVDGKLEVVVIGSEGLRKQQLFEGLEAAERFRGELAAELRSKGFTLAWTNAVG